MNFTSEGRRSAPTSARSSRRAAYDFGPQTDTSIDSRGVGPITAFQASFTINSTFPVGTVTGNQAASTDGSTPALAAFGSCDPTGSSPRTTWWPR